jgi:uncharacterized protein YdeI (YjbR/CyaY-like superfamily)
MANLKDRTKIKPSKSKQLPIMSFEKQVHWQKWLAKHHAVSDGVWLRLEKKGSDQKSVTYAEALDVALCYGWIDGQKKSYDSHSWIQKFTRRRAQSIWSKKNTKHVERLGKAGKMKKAGLDAVRAAKEDGRWEAAYDSATTSQIPEDFLNALSRNKKAQAFFQSLNKTNLYAIAYRLQTAKKPETREKRMKIILEMMVMGQKFHP